MQHGFEEAHFHNTIDGPFARVTTKTAQLRAKAQKSMDRHVDIHGRIFRQITDESFGGNWFCRDVMTSDGDRSVRWRNESCDHPHRRGLARTVRAEKAQNFAALDAKG